MSRKGGRSGRVVAVTQPVIPESPGYGTTPQPITMMVPRSIGPSTETIEPLGDPVMTRRRLIARLVRAVDEPEDPQRVALMLKMVDILGEEGGQTPAETEHGSSEPSAALAQKSDEELLRDAGYEVPEALRPQAMEAPVHADPEPMVAAEIEP